MNVVSGGDDAGGSHALTVVIVNWNGGQTVLDCLASLRDAPPLGVVEAIVIDNASGDGSPDAIRRSMPWVRLVQNAANRGLASANNQGLRLSGSPYVLISNPDIVYRAGSIDALVDLLERREKAAFAVARLVRPDGTPQTAAGDLPSLGEALLGRWWQRRRSSDRGFWWDGWAHDEECVIGHGMEACYLVRRAAVAEIGPQDERFPLDWEGIDWSARVAASGWQVWFCPKAEVVHLGGVSLRQAQLRWVLRSHQGMYRYFAKRRSLVWRPILAVAFGGRGLVKGTAIAAGWWSYRHSEPEAVEGYEPPTSDR